MIKIASAIFCTLMCFSIQAQKVDSTKTAVQYFGIQGNELYREILSFGNNNAPIINPYLLTYAVNSKKSGWGLNVGFGYDVDKFSDGDETFSRDTDRSNFNLRTGFEKKSRIGKRFQVSLGLDILYEKQVNNTTTETEIDFGNNREGKIKVETDIETKTLGIGPRGTLNFFITKRFIIGTEVTYYYAKSNIDELSKTESDTFDFNPNTGEFDLRITSTEENEVSSSHKSFNMQLPIVLFLIFSF
ncbi:MAG: hypothetical protein JXR07_14405 [Reichenbachiella sp.]